MGLLSWAITGLVAGALARWVVKAEKRGCLTTMVIGLVGALIGGALYRFGTGDDFDFDGFDLAEVGVSFVGAAVLLLVLQAIEGRGEIGRR